MMIGDIFRSISFYFDSISKVRRFGLTKLLFIPILLSGIVGLVVLYFSYLFSDDLGNFITSWYQFETGSTIVKYIGQFVGGMAIFALSMFVFRYLIFILLSPFLSYLSEQLSNKLRSEIDVQELEGISILHGVLRGLKMTMNYGLKELSLLIFAFILGFIPIIGFASPLLIILIEAYYIGVGNMDFALENRLDYSESKSFIRRRKGLILGNGIIGLLILLIPIVGIFVMPSLSVCAATLAVHHALDK